MLRVAIDRLVLAQHPVQHAGGLLVVDFPLLAEVDAADPLVLNLLERRLYFENGSQLIKEVP